MFDNTKTDEFSEKFQTAFDPHPPFLENLLQLFSFMFKKPPLKVQNLQHDFFDEPPHPPAPLEVFQKFMHFGTVGPSFVPKLSVFKTNNLLLGLSIAKASIKHKKMCLMG